MPQKRTLLVLFAGAAAVVALGAVHRASEGQFRMLQQEIRAVAAEQRQNATAIEGETSRPPPAVWAPASPIPASAPSYELAEGEPPGSTGAPQGGRSESDAPTEADQAAYVAVAFSQEVFDPAWAKDTERSIGASLQELAESSTLEAVECRQSLCRASLKHPGQTQFSAFVDRVVARSTELWTGQVYSHVEPTGDDGVVRNTMYFARHGHSLPLLE